MIGIRDSISMTAFVPFGSHSNDARNYSAIWKIHPFKIFSAFGDQISNNVELAPIHSVEWGRHGITSTTNNKRTCNRPTESQEVPVLFGVEISRRGVSRYEIVV